MMTNGTDAILEECEAGQNEEKQNPVGERRDVLRVVNALYACLVASLSLMLVDLVLNP
jgi:hypothetical protein